MTWLRRTFRPTVHPLFAAGAIVALSCGDDTAPTPSNPIPVLLSVSPTQLVAGNQGATLTLAGSQFVRSSRVRWNGGDRVTAYVSDNTLTAQLTSSDLAVIGTGTLTVVNPPPDGGTSGSISVSIGYPAPTITALAPNAAVVGAPTMDVTVTGTGFVPQSTARWNGMFFLSVTFLSPTQITVSLGSSFLTTSGSGRITIVNPAPGGGTSNAGDFSVANPVPQIAALTPDTALTNAALMLGVAGSGFVSASRVRWNGSDRITTFVNSSRLTAIITPGDVVSAMTASITVFNPAPGGGTSNALSLIVREAPPIINAVNPATITSGAPSASLTISGNNFSTSSIVQWNGQQRPTTFVNALTLTTTLSLGDLSTPSTGLLTVLNPAPSGLSNALAVAILPASPTVSVSATVVLQNSDIAYDSTRNLIYASVPSSGGTHANSVVKLDPVNGSIIGSVAVGSDPQSMAISDDAWYLYVALSSTPIVVRIDLTTFTKDIQFQLGNGSLGPHYAEDLLVLPGSPRSVVISRRNGCCSPRHEGVAVYDDGIARPKTTQGHTGSNRVVRGPTSVRIYGYNNETTEFGLRSIVVAADGLTEETASRALIDGGFDIEYDAGFIYATTGAVIQVPSMTIVGTIPTSGVVWPDAAHARVHFLANAMVQTFHYTSFASIGTFTHVSLADLTRVKRWGSNGLVAGGGDRIVFLRGSLVAP